MITDTSGNPINLFTFLLTEGQESAPQTIRVTPLSLTETLRAEYAAEVNLWGKIGGGGYVNLSTTGLVVGWYVGDKVDVIIKAVASGDITGAVRKWLFLGSSRGTPAAWTI